ncbi:gliding motility lipoprotein GldH [Sphingobacterium sp. DN00404]|uniref:Gliding motility lipoprotein GldH n=1 Tax=Sphingobacterium micropteri TaxID=2763501 RepID=A0ABR7YQ23_9SPHI|nr:gliding motility lipoprotein GldH [Sphingobacterium micropteri]MBD1433321.1 gliding motility lipoprotein GldH [Sphingobacterium micropteri]
MGTNPKSGLIGIKIETGTKHQITIKAIARCVFGFCLLFFVLACVNEPFYDVYKSTANRQWHHHERQTFQVHIDRNNGPYDVWVYIRHTGEYDFANFFFLSHETGPRLKDTSYRHELKLATSDGRWTGKSAGNLYENRRLLKENYTFPDTGMYTFEIEQNMQENPILDITDVGLKIVRK